MASGVVDVILLENTEEATIQENNLDSEKNNEEEQDKE